ncbi:MAG: choice-of-anchor T family protein [Candidatus Thermoplasmatota archaeon]|jgi:hypothetical protein|nr:choice-of-anchor T family protein [Candidatus Thermoplasmatota archaeon]MDP7264141.1 choice-of-anchor T family protein [Candidatus Thermoplasmatota archaeon]
MRDTQIKLLLMSFVLIGAFFIGMVEVPGEAEAAQPVATIALDNPEQTAKVGPGENGIVTFSGVVSVQMIGPGSNVQLIVVKLTAESPWVTSITPSTLTFEAQNPSPLPFTVVVKVPNFQSFTTQGNVQVSGTVNTIPGALLSNIAPAGGIITIEPYYQLRVSCTEPYIEISPGDPIIFAVTVKNEGNSQDRISLDIPNQEALTDDEWVISLGTRTMMLEEKKEQVIKFSVTPPQDWTLYRNRVTRIELVVKSDTSIQAQSAMPETQYFDFFVRDKGMYIPGFEPMFALLALVIVAAAFKKFRD